MLHMTGRIALVEIRDTALERQVQGMVKDMRADPRFIGKPLENDPPDVAIARIAAESRATFEAIASWAREEVEFMPANDETEIERNNRVARNNAVLKTLGEWQDRSIKAADIQAKLGLAAIKTGIAGEHLSLAKLGELRALAGDKDVSEAMAKLASTLRPVLEGEAVED